MRFIRTVVIIIIIIIQRGKAMLNAMLISHRMQNLVPLHESMPSTICVVQQLKC